MLNTDSTLFELLDTQSANLFDEQGFAVHCPMVLTALARMGASDQQLRNYYAHWQTENPALAKVSHSKHSNADGEIRIDNWQQYLQQVDSFSPLQNFFQSWIKNSSADSVMLQVLSQIPIAPASVAFHGLIRLAYGLEANHHGEIAAALAALVTRNFAIPLQHPADRQPAASVAQGLTHLSHSMQDFETPERNITARIRAVIADPRFAQNLPPIPANAFEDMAMNAIILFHQTRHFTVLHMVTALHAARIIFAHLPDELFHQFLSPLWTAYCAAYVSAGAPRINTITHVGNILPWDTLLTAACTSTQDHQIKMIYTCHQEYLRSDSLEAKQLYLESANAFFAS